MSQAEAELVFFNEPLLIVEDVSHSSRETRLHAFGHMDAGRVASHQFHATWRWQADQDYFRARHAPQGTMHRKERLRYEKEA